MLEMAYLMKFTTGEMLSHILQRYGVYHAKKATMIIFSPHMVTKILWSSSWTNQQLFLEPEWALSQ